MRILILLTALLLSPALFAQISVKVQPNRQQYISFESINVNVTINNQAGRPLTLRNTANSSWIEFVVRNQSGNTVNQLQNSSYKGVQIPTGESIKSSFRLNNSFNISEPGNYSVYAIVRTPEQGDRGGTRSSTAYFTINRGTTEWSAKVGVPGAAGDQREYRTINFNPGSGVPPQLYLQVEDIKSGRMLACYSMGRSLSFRKSLKAIDKSNKLHVLSMSTPELYCHTIVNTSGKTIKRNYYKSLGSTHPSLMTHKNGSVSVLHGVIYDPKKEQAEKGRFHNLSEMP